MSYKALIKAASCEHCVASHHVEEMYCPWSAPKEMGAQMGCTSHDILNLHNAQSRRFWEAGLLQKGIMLHLGLDHAHNTNELHHSLFVSRPWSPLQVGLGLVVFIRIQVRLLHSHQPKKTCKSNSSGVKTPVLCLFVEEAEVLPVSFLLPTVT